jgi:hypothetical protein
VTRRKACRLCASVIPPGWTRTATWPHPRLIPPGIGLPPLDRLQTRRAAHRSHNGQRIEAGRVTLERRRSPQADTNVGSITAEISGRPSYEKLAASRTPGSDARCGDRSCKPSVRLAQARRGRSHSIRSLLTPAASGARRHSPPCSQSDRNGALSRVPDAVKPAVSPPCLAETTLSPQPKGPAMLPPSRPTHTTPSAPCQRTRPAARATCPQSLVDQGDRSCRLIKVGDIQLEAHDLGAAGAIA